MTRPLDVVAWPVTTTRLVIRPATPDDCEAVFGFRRLPEVYAWITQAPLTLAEFREQWLDPASLAKTLVIELDGRIVGDLMVSIRDAWGQGEVAGLTLGVEAELGWVLHPSYAGQGLATEAVEAVLGLCFGPLGLRRVVALCFADNTASWRLMERVGMRRESHTVRDSLHRSGTWLDGYSYAVLAEEWPGHRRGRHRGGRH